MRAPGTGLRRTWPQRLLITFNCVLIALCLAGAGLLGYFYDRFGDLPRAEFAAGVLDEDDPGDPQNFLLVGSDTRAFTEGNDQAVDSFGDTADVPGQRSDTIMLVRVDPRSETAAMVSFPRDLWVTNPITGDEGRINTAFEGGPEQLVRTISENFGIPIHHYLQVDFNGFKGLVDAVDGVEVYLPNPVRDWNPRPRPGFSPSGLDIAETGCVSLSGDQALSYVRSRYFQELVDGRWRADPTSDLGRIARQQDFIRRAVNEAISNDLLNPARVNQLVDVAINNVTVDPNLDVRDIVNLGQRFRSLTPGALQQYTLPTENARIGGADVLLLVGGQETENVLDIFRGIPPADPSEVAPASVTVQVLNGSGVAGQATAVRDGLAAAGFAVAGVGNADSTDTTTIRYAAGQAHKAALAARYLDPQVQPVEDAALQNVGVEVTTGSNFIGLLAEPRPAEDLAVAEDPTEVETDDPVPQTPPC